ncbi:hypothetical protein FOL47_010020 [Perkinsus chesapeaki]|uniref:Protein kinase domain-containing protein n=1 Tax=Perkinsus chesapeaki TaxID=330153 RepID=A0A7J6MSE1_PERCH|nr:hypothetical protein FOL47_010020 [Perkinsus chesapeaki]
MSPFKRGEFEWIGKEWGWKTTIMNRYVVQGTDFLGQGSFSVVRKAFDKQLKIHVAIKTYLEKSPSVFEKFVKQIDILKQLQEPLKKKLAHRTPTQSFKMTDFTGKNRAGRPSQAQQLLVHSEMDPGKVFVKLLDYSKDATGKPAPAKDGKCYVVLELASYTLEDYLKDRRKANDPMEMWEVHHVVRSLISITAILHAKELVHLDIKPENIMRVGDDWKLIDVDGAVPASTTIDLDDNTVSFTPLYCAPEFARALIDGSERLRISRMMDVWSVGMTALDLVLARPALETKYMALYERTGDTLAFFNWLSNPTIALSVPNRLKYVDEDLYDLLQNKMLIKRTLKRASVLECLEHPFCTKQFEVPPSDSAAKSYIFDIYERSSIVPTSGDGPPEITSQASAANSCSSIAPDGSVNASEGHDSQTIQRQHQEYDSQVESINADMQSGTEDNAALYGARSNLERRRSVLTHMKSLKSFGAESSELCDEMNEEAMQMAMKRGRRVSVAQITQINKLAKFNSTMTITEEHDPNSNSAESYEGPNRSGSIKDTEEVSTLNLPGEPPEASSFTESNGSKNAMKKRASFAVKMVTDGFPDMVTPSIHDTACEGLMVPRSSVIMQNRRLWCRQTSLSNTMVAYWAQIANSTGDPLLTVEDREHLPRVRLAHSSLLHALARRISTHKGTFRDNCIVFRCRPAFVYVTYDSTKDCTLACIQSCGISNISLASLEELAKSQARIVDDIMEKHVGLMARSCPVTQPSMTNSNALKQLCEAFSTDILSTSEKWFMLGNAEAVAIETSKAIRMYHQTEFRPYNINMPQRPIEEPERCMLAIEIYPTSLPKHINKMILCIVYGSLNIVEGSRILRVLNEHGVLIERIIMSSS